MKYVYLLKMKDSDAYKIGVSNKPTHRLSTLQTGNASEILIVETYETDYAKKIETSLHNQFSHFRKTGEWFLLSIKEESEFLDNCKRIENNIKILIENGNEFI